MVITVNLNEVQQRILSRIMEAKALKTKSSAIVLSLVDEYTFLFGKDYAYISNGDNLNSLSQETSMEGK